MEAQIGDRLTTLGNRVGADVNIPLVGEELATARALMDLAESLGRAAATTPEPGQREAHLTDA